MSRSGYSDYCEYNWRLIRWRGAVASAIRGKCGQTFLREMLAALNAMPTKRLIAEELEAHGEVCAIGAVGARRGIDMSKIDAYDRERVAAIFGIAPALVAEIMFENDETCGYWVNDETPEHRWERMRRWIASQIKS